MVRVSTDRWQNAFQPAVPSGRPQAGAEGLLTPAYRPDSGAKEPTAAGAEWKTWIEGLIGKNGVGKHTGPIKK